MVAPRIRGVAVDHQGRDGPRVILMGFVRVDLYQVVGYPPRYGKADGQRRNIPRDRDARP